MIRGIGVDISAPKRFEDMGERMLSRLFTEREIENAPLRSSEYYAARFAAKEAFAKAMGTGIRGFSLMDIEIVEDENGKPGFLLRGRAAELAAGMVLHLSLSHEREMAVAMVVAEDAQ